MPRACAHARTGQQAGPELPARASREGCGSGVRGRRAPGRRRPAQRWAASRERTNSLSFEAAAALVALAICDGELVGCVWEQNTSRPGRHFLSADPVVVVTLCGARCRWALDG